MKLTVQVRPQADDSTNVPTLCPVAQALRLAVGLKRATWKTARRGHAFAQAGRLFARGATQQIMCKTPGDVLAWITTWDDTGQGESFDFEVEATAPTPVSADYLIPGTAIWGMG